MAWPKFVADIGYVLWLSLPLILANMLPPLIGRNARPIHEGLFGRNKTWVGLIGGIIGGVIVTAILIFSMSIVADNRMLYLIWGYSDSVRVWHIVAMATGALLGDLVKSFFKRRNGRPPGSPWPYFDQLDAVVGGFVLCWVVDLLMPHRGWWFHEVIIPGRWLPLLLLIPVYLVLHGLVSRQAHQNGLKSTPH